MILIMEVIRLIHLVPQEFKISYRSKFNSNTNYTFSIAASDPTGNCAANNAIIINATTLGFVGCDGTSNEASQLCFFQILYSFETLGTNLQKLHLSC